MPREKEYTNGEVTIVWKPNLCIHSKNCINGLPDVFNVDARPWIDAKGARTEAIIEQVKNCPSGALTTYLNSKGKQEEKSLENGGAVEVKIIQNGPIMVKGQIEITQTDGNTVTHQKSTALCRCGSSSNKPYCDGSHKKINFQA